ncbi:putative triacylglycerol lipase [Mytilinidion resinicola]|uniref:Carboxylic ester hydrolase n=1 Tax=Mytilinidion resinicola TaxID=574789 RepID=A0A6A6YYT9_9PEZI|nr:putative triacylglycerol lipase [Mytilinidion resinicola]KAF2813991.1 putative triacylglycerol lipase [Mytilinidion resinicola]
MLRVVVLALLTFGRQAGAVSPLVSLPSTSYQGTPLANGISQWLGIRYAAPPVGQLRFQAPQDPIASYQSVQIADQHGLICLGTAQDPNDDETSEDCLFLDVYAPTNATESSKLPVYFFIQGGGFNTNSNANYNGTGLIQVSGMNIVVVTFNYRVGPYGFLAGKEVVVGGSLNNGLKDQRKAMEWVQKYICKFGGDPQHVVVGGNSAGAASISLHVTAYGGRDDHLFHATAAESQSFAALMTADESQFAYDNLIIRTGCLEEIDTLSCLRSLNATFLQENNFNTPFPGAQQAPLYMYGPTLDGDLIQDYTYRAYEQGHFLRLPAIYGDDTNEGTVFIPKLTNSIGNSSAFLQSQFPALTLDQLRTISIIYPVAEQFPDSGRYWRQVSNAYGEIRYICPGIYISNAYSRLGLQSNWNYHWDVHDPDDDAVGYGVKHTVEVNAIWGPENVNGGAPPSYSTTNAPIVPVVQAYWTSFVRSFNPNTYRLPGTPKWEEWTLDGYQRLKFKPGETAMEVVPDNQKGRCAYLSSIGVSIKQ